MVESTYQLDTLFASLSDPIRRDILQRVSTQSLSIGEIANHYSLSFAGVAKHLHVLERAKLITKTRRGKEQLVTLVPEALSFADNYLETYRNLWEKRFDSLEEYLQKVTRKD